MDQRHSRKQSMLLTKLVCKPKFRVQSNVKKEIGEDPETAWGGNELGKDKFCWKLLRKLWWNTLPGEVQPNGKKIAACFNFNTCHHLYVEQQHLCKLKWINYHWLTIRLLLYHLSPKQLKIRQYFNQPKYIFIRFEQKLCTQWSIR